MQSNDYYHRETVVSETTQRGKSFKNGMKNARVSKICSNVISNNFY